ncbi:uncharacterized protein (DUF58 family) [Ereboglobus sp. PH5-5]|uniref:DUF58 domain-containing protein n=1 Tax=Ereboglobus sp. PH5-5 TaxID=2940529 RepID=UPI0024071EC3|nr:DUF58 domain-containing protein [Ereboglobus sp. PH5-5]MDF9832637.1 uncharacterized protein (DUF58 family) [Ereboglobus sp. PH5-5]
MSNAPAANPIAQTTSSPHREGIEAARRYRLPFGRQSWRGYQGAWQGAGTGSSIDFQDHRAYAPGDDPRYIHWAAYARTGQLTMKLYRAEVSPMVDVVVDVSESMTFDAAKAARTEALVAFAVASADAAGAPVRVFAARGRETRPVPVESARAGDWRGRLALVGRALPSAPSHLPWRAGALKVLVCDLLFPGDPSLLLSAMSAGGGSAVVFAPALATEAEPPLRGNVELVDCESGEKRHQRIDDDLAARYGAAYERHFELWDESARRCGATLVRVPCEDALVNVLGGEALVRGAVEVTR